MAAQANFVRVKVERLDDDAGGSSGSGGALPPPPRTRLLCVVRGLLKKMKREVLVGDFVRVVGIDWTDGRGERAPGLPLTATGRGRARPGGSFLGADEIMMFASLPGSTTSFSPAPLTLPLLLPLLLPSPSFPLSYYSPSAPGMVEEVLPRRSRLAEPAVANVTQVVLVFSLARPPFAPGPATRYLVGAEAAGLPVTLLLNKADLLGEEEVQAVVDEVAGWGYNAVPVSVASGRGMRELGTALAGKVSVLAGPSGAGKSSIINVLRRDAHAEAVADAEAAEAADAAAAAAELAGAEEACSGGESGSGSECEAEEEEADEEGQAAAADDADAYAEGGAEMQAVGEVSERIGRGKHTTRNVTLLEMGAGGGLLVDTPGFNQPDVSALPAAELAQYFPEIQAVLAEQRCAGAGAAAGAAAAGGSEPNRRRETRRPHWRRQAQRCRSLSPEGQRIQQLKPPPPARHGVAGVCLPTASTWWSRGAP